MNLLPEENKILFKKYYLKRLFAVFAVLIFSIVAIGAVVLIPMHLLILSYKNDLNAKLAAYVKKDVELTDSVADLEIKKLNNRLDSVGKMSKTKELNPIFQNILARKNQGVKITSFSYEKGKEPENEGNVHLSGVVKTRDDLLLFENQLKKDWGENKVVSPVSNLINEKDFNFSLILRVKNEK